MSPLAERRWHLLAEDLRVRGIESAAEMTGSSSEAAIASKPGTTRSSRDIQEKRSLRQVMSLSPFQRPAKGLPLVVVVFQLLRNEARKVGVVEGEHEPRVRIVEAAEHRVVVVVVRDVQRVLDPTADDDVLAEREPLDLGGNLVGRNPVGAEP